jgi:hypothetical protein
MTIKELRNYCFSSAEKLSINSLNLLQSIQTVASMMYSKKGEAEKVYKDFVEQLDYSCNEEFVGAEILIKKKKNKGLMDFLRSKK